MSDAMEDPELSSFLGDVTENGSSKVINDPVFGQVIEEPATDEPFADATVEIGDGACSVCGAPTFRPPGLTKTGRQKRIPKYCDLHSPNARIPSDGPAATRLESQLQRVQQELADDLRLGGTLVGFAYPVTGYYVIDNADAFTTALLKLCKNNQRMLRVLHRAAQVAPVYEVAKVVGGTAYSVQVDMNKADPHNTIAQRLGVSRAFDAIYAANLNDTQGASFNQANNGMKPPPRYATVN